MDNVEKIRELLNFSGYPFQHYCADRIDKIDDFQVSAEVPFTHPATNGPMLGVHGAIDIIAAHPDISGDVLVFFIIECKKANDKIKNWILMPNKQQNPKWSTFFFTQQSPGQPLQGSVTRSVTFPRLGYAQSEDFDFCINGIEANTDMSKTNQDQREKVYNPLKQAAHGTRAFEASFPKVVEGIEYLRDARYMMHLYVPVIITTANIFIADIPVERVAQGEIPPGALSLSEAKKWATVEFALPDYLSYSVIREDEVGGNVGIPKRTIFIVNDKSIDDFFTGALEVANLAAKPKS